MSLYLPTQAQATNSPTNLEHSGLGHTVREDHYVQRVSDMLALAAKTSDPDARKEFERLAEEYKALALNAQKQAQP
jgi:hypothetical protein